MRDGWVHARRDRGQFERVERLAVTVVVVISASVLLSIYLAVRGVLRLEPSAALRFD